jgi:hypothetical protein
VWGAPGSGGGGGGPSLLQFAQGYWIAPVQATIGNGVTMAADQIYLYPFALPRSLTIGELGARVNSAAAGSSVQLAIYGSLNGEPSGAPLASTGSLSAGLQGPVSSSVANFNLSAFTNYWFATQSDGAPVLQHVTGSGQNIVAAVVGAPTIAQLTNAASSSAGWRQLSSNPFGTWPTLTPGATTTQNGSARGGLVYLQIAALL